MPSLHNFNPNEDYYNNSNILLKTSLFLLIMCARNDEKLDQGKKRAFIEALSCLENINIER